MKFATLAALLSVTSAQITKCESQDDCLAANEAAFTGGCCGQWTVASIGEE